MGLTVIIPFMFSEEEVLRAIPYALIVTIIFTLYFAHERKKLLRCPFCQQSLVLPLEVKLFNKKIKVRRRIYEIDLPEHCPHCLSQLS